ncbi:hypothetical protein MRB53_002294 [Persea americana]|uniref:Uncharacterized protein n=1 Tax=Persea americana TaxID=3435 RepID=A0ACC2MU35_PERAE|nr:hypothetical protein MRB53_002294 [Persea americana]
MATGSGSQRQRASKHKPTLPSSSSPLKESIATIFLEIPAVFPLHFLLLFLFSKLQISRSAFGAVGIAEERPEEAFEPPPAREWQPDDVL